ncbi:MAG: hypothetical protein J2P49_05585 [Methylocapsa sp.]|nr:hypothetical protein [Methylocapsa sp.]
MIGKAAGIAGSHGVPPQAMAQLLLSAKPGQKVILAIDDAHSLPKESLSYIALMTELLATETPVLQAVLAAGPDLLDTLAQPEYAIFRNRICRPEFVTFRNLQWGRAEKPLQTGVRARAAPPQSIRQPLAAPAQRQPSSGAGGRSRLALYTALGCLATSIVAASGYVIFLAMRDSPPPPSTWLKSGVTQKSGVPAAPPPPAPAGLTPRQTDQAIDTLIDELVDAVAQGSFGIGSGDKVSVLLARIATLKAGASPDGVKLVIDMPNRFAAGAKAAKAAGRVEEARRLEYFSAGESGTAKPETTAHSNPGDRPPPPRRKAVSGASSANTAAQMKASKDQSGAAERRSELRKDAAAPASSNDALQEGSARPPERLATAGSDANEPPGPPATPNASQLPAAAPARVVLDMARRDAGWVQRAEDVRQLLTGAGVTVANVVAVHSQWSKPRIGYYFRPDRVAAASISRRLKPLLGATEPELLPARRDVEPGTIEIAVP